MPNLNKKESTCRSSGILKNSFTLTVTWTLSIYHQIWSMLTKHIYSQIYKSWQNISNYHLVCSCAETTCSRGYSQSIIIHLLIKWWWWSSSNNMIIIETGRFQFTKLSLQSLFNEGSTIKQFGDECVFHVNIEHMCYQTALLHLSWNSFTITITITNYQTPMVV